MNTTNTTKRASIKQVSPGLVTLSYSEGAERVTRWFTCGKRGGYIYESGTDGDWFQPCEGLGRGLGNTLKCVTQADLLAAIRYEYYAMRRAQRAARLA